MRVGVGEAKLHLHRGSAGLLLLFMEARTILATSNDVAYVCGDLGLWSLYIYKNNS